MWKRFLLMLVAIACAAPVQAQYQRTLIIGSAQPITVHNIVRLGLAPFDAPDKVILLTGTQYQPTDHVPAPVPTDNTFVFNQTDVGKALVVIGQRVVDSRGEFVWSAAILDKRTVIDGVKLWLEWKDKNIGQYFSKKTTPCPSGQAC